METRAGTASSPATRTADGTGPGGSASPSRPGTTSVLGETGSDLTLTEMQQAEEDEED